MSTDPDIVAQILAGDREAFGELVERHQSRLIAIAGLRLGDPELAEEAVHTAFIQAYERLRDFDPVKGEFGAWIYAILRYVVMDIRRKEQRPRRRSLEHLERIRHLLVAALAERDHRDEDADERLRALARCQEELSGTARMLIALRYTEACEGEDIANRLGRSESWVSTNLHRIRLALRQCIERRVPAASR